MVVDLGGGSFKITFWVSDQNMLDGKATGGDPYLGGIDIDKELVEYCAQQFEAETGINCRAQWKAMSRLMHECGKAKIILNHNVYK